MKQMGVMAEDRNGNVHFGNIVHIKNETYIETPEKQYFPVNHRTVNPIYAFGNGINYHTGFFDSDGREILVGDVVEIIHHKWGLQEEDGVAVAVMEMSEQYGYIMKYDSVGYGFSFNQNVLTAKYGDGTDFCKKEGEYCESRIIGHISDENWSFSNCHNFESVLKGVTYDQ